MSQKLAGIWPWLTGAGFGLGLARYLYESHPRIFIGLSGFPGLLLWLAIFGVLGGGLFLRLRKRWPNLNHFNTWPLLLPLLSAFAPEVNPLRDQTLLLGSLALTLLCLLQPRLPDVVLPGLLFLSVGAIYLSTLAPAVGEADTFEFQVGIARLGVAHGSGYPLLMLVGKLFSLLPVGGTLAFRANLTSAFFGALAAVGVERFVHRLGVAPLPAFLTGLLFGLSPTLWSRAVEVEAYTLNAAFVILILHLCLSLLVPTSTSHYPLFTLHSSLSTIHSSLFTLHCLAFLFGLSLTNHLTTVLLAPACAFALFRAYQQQPQAFAPPLKHLSIALLFLLLGFSIYLYIPLRWPAVNNGEWLSLERFLNILTGNEAKGAFQWALPFTDFNRYLISFRKITDEFGYPGLALATLGLFSLTLLPRFRPNSSLSTLNSSLLTLLILAFLPYLYFALAFNVPDPDFSAFFIPLHLIAAIFIGLGLQMVWQVATQRFSHSGPMVLTLFALLPLSAVWATYPHVNQANDWAQQRFGQYMLSFPLAPNATVLADSQKIAPLYYLQVAEGVRPDLDIVVLPDEASYRAVLDERLAQGQPVYLGRYLPGLGSGYSLRSLGPLAEASPQLFTAPPFSITQPLSLTVLEGLQLLGYTQDATRFTFFWQPTAPLTQHLLVNLRLLDDRGHVLWRSAGSVPVNNLYPTNAWRVGEIISDFYEVEPGPTLAPGDYRLQIGFFPPFAAEVENSPAWVEVAAFHHTLPATPPQPQILARITLGSHTLLGFDAPHTAAPGAPVYITTYWVANAQPLSLFGETHSLAAWPTGSVVPIRSTFTAPTGTASFPITLNPTEPIQCGWLQSPTATCTLTTIELTGEPAVANAINFNNLIWLRQVDLATPQVMPGDEVQVTLHWQGQQTLSEDYTAFVHLIGPDGLVHGQVDSWPVAGTFATSRWPPGQVIVDPYLVRVPPDAPPGEYQIEIGFYLLATLERLPVLNTAGAPIEDKVLVPGLTVGE